MTRMLHPSRRPGALVRWALVLPAALAAALLAQVAGLFVQFGVTRLLLEPQQAADLVWPVKAATSLLMGGAFVSAAAWTAPSHRGRVALASLIPAAWWAVPFFSSGLTGWGPLLGSAGLLGAGLTAFVVWQVSTPPAALASA